METINLEIDKELLNEIRTLSAADKEIQEIRREKASGTTLDGKIALGLCCPGQQHPATTHIKRPP